MAIDMVARSRNDSYAFLAPPGERQRTIVTEFIMKLTDYIRDIPDFPKAGILFKDITPLLSEPRAFQHAIQMLSTHYQDRGVDAIAAAEARGFLVAAPLALALKLPLIPLRKPGKLPYETHFFQYELEYGTAELHVHIDAIRPEARVLVVDDLLATGGTLRAGCQLVEKAGGQVAGCAVLLELTFLRGREKLEPYEVFSLVQY
jgi:adenine phosphoribosyltransferase